MPISGSHSWDSCASRRRTWYGAVWVGVGAMRRWSVGHTPPHRHTPLTHVHMRTLPPLACILLPCDSIPIRTTPSRRPPTYPVPAAESSLMKRFLGCCSWVGGWRRGRCLWCVRQAGGPMLCIMDRRKSPSRPPPTHTIEWSRPGTDKSSSSLPLPSIMSSVVCRLPIDPHTGGPPSIQ